MGRLIGATVKSASFDTAEIRACPVSTLSYAWVPSRKHNPTSFASLTTSLHLGRMFRRWCGFWLRLHCVDA